MIHDELFPYALRGYLSVQVKKISLYLTLKYEYKQVKIIACIFHSYLALVWKSWKAAQFYNGYQLAKKNF